MKKLALLVLLLSQCGFNYSLQCTSNSGSFNDNVLNDNETEAAPINDNIAETDSLDRQPDPDLHLGRYLNSVARYCMDGMLFLGGIFLYNLDNVDRGINLFGIALSSSVVLTEGMMNIFENIAECINDN